MRRKKSGQLLEVQGRLLIPGGMYGDTWVELRAVEGAETDQEGGLSQVREALDLDVREVRRLRLLLAREAKEEPERRAFGRLAADWLKRVSKVRVRPKNEEWQLKHMKRLAGMTQAELTKGVVEDLLGDLLKPAGPLCASSVNKIRSAGRLIIEDAQGNGHWSATNPFDLAKPMKPRTRVYATLTIDEVVLVLPFMRRDRRRLSKTVLLTGMRPGEGLGLEKPEVDLEKRMIKVCRSHGRDQTKTGKERVFPIPDELVEDLRQAIDESPSNLVFPKPDGTRWRADTKLARMLRTAMGKAGIVSGYRYSCRRKGCGHREEHKLVQLEELRCPKCAFKLWGAPIPKHLRFYDLRHTSATLHREAKCDPMVIQEMLGHKMNLTDGTYTHVDSEYKRSELNKLKLKRKAPT